MARPKGESSDDESDVDLASVTSVASAVTPMPGGTGLMTVACLMENTVAAAERQGVAV